MLRKALIVGAAVGVLFVAGCEGTPSPSTPSSDPPKVQPRQTRAEVESINGDGDGWELSVDGKPYKISNGLSKVTYQWDADTVIVSRTENLTWKIDFGTNIAKCTLTPPGIEFDGNRTVTLRAPAVFTPVEVTVACSG